MMKNTIAAIWGFAEAVLFFIVPDVWLSWIGLKDLKKALIACMYSLAGALIGGSVMYFYAAHDYESAFHAIDAVPAVSPAMIRDVAENLKEKGVISILLGPLQGIPYKTYAVNAFASDVSFMEFILISIPARWIRFVLVTALSHFIIRAVMPNSSLTRRTYLLLAAWSVFYIFYFYRMPN